MAREYSPEGEKAWLENLYSIPAAAAMFLEDPDGLLLIVKANYRKYWTPPGGVIDEGESPKQAALREISEEVGLEIAPDDARFICVLYRKSDLRDTYQFIFGAPITRVVAQAVTVQESEIEAYAFVTKEQVQGSDRLYSSTVTAWANGAIGYDELVLTSS